MMAALFSFDLPLARRPVASDKAYRPRAAARAAGIPLNFVLIAGFLSWRATSAVAGDDSQNSALPSVTEERFAIHGQFTYVEQGTDSFRAPYAGPNSLSPNQGRETTDLHRHAQPSQLPDKLTLKRAYRPGGAFGWEAGPGSVVCGCTAGAASAGAGAASAPAGASSAGAAGSG